MIDSGWLKLVLVSISLPLLGGIFATLNKRISNKVNKDVCAERNVNFNKRLDSHDELLNKIYAKVEETNINVAKLTVRDQ